MWSHNEEVTPQSGAVFKKGDKSGTPEDREFPVGAKNKNILK